MKRLIMPLLLLAFLLGCGGESTQQTTAPTETVQPTQMTEPAGLYIPDSEAEQLSDGALRMYQTGDDTGFALEMMGEDILLFSGSEETVLTRFTGDNLYPIARTELSCAVHPEDPSFQISSKGITYYDDAANALVFLDNDLKEVRRVDVPENIVGTPVLSGNRLQLYYCTADAVRVLDLETGLDRLLKQVSYEHQTAQGLLFHDTVLLCSIGDEDGYFSVFISVKTGELVSELRENVTVTGAEDRYYGIFHGETMEEMIFGTTDSDVQMLIPEEPFGDMWFLENLHSAVTRTCEDSVTAFAFYDLSSGMRTAALEIPGDYYPWQLASAGTESGIYIIGSDMSQEGPVIYRWDLEKSIVEDQTQYICPRYTADAPDEDGLAECARRAEEIGSRYGLKIITGENAVSVQPWDYDLEAEYHVPVIDRDLDTLERTLEKYPDGFFQSINEDIRICLVRGLQGSAESGSLDTANGIQFWEKGSAYVVLAAGDTLEATLFHELFHVIDNHVLSACNAYYDWERLNPEGFSYDFDYISNLNRDPVQYLEDGTRAFIDTYSMSFPKEDRARIMEYAATADHGYYFESEIMQRKLRTLCEGIRIAFDLRECPVAFVWEQYLQEPLTP